jgi:hypothetical protein
MTIFEVREGVFINLDNICKFKIEKVSSGNYAIQFFHDKESIAESIEFASETEAIDWLSLRIIRSAGANEILLLNA